MRYKIREPGRKKKKIDKETLADIKKRAQTTKLLLKEGQSLIYQP